MPSLIENSNTYMCRRAAQLAANSSVCNVCPSLAQVRWGRSGTGDLRAVENGWMKYVHISGSYLKYAKDCVW